MLFVTSEAMTDADCTSFAVNTDVCEVEKDGTFLMTFPVAGLDMKICVKFTGSESFILMRNVTVDVLHLSGIGEKRIVAGTSNTLTLQGVGLSSEDKVAVVPSEAPCPSDLSGYFDVEKEESFSAEVMVPEALNVTYKVCYKFGRYSTPIPYDYFLEVLDVRSVEAVMPVVRNVPVLLTYAVSGFDVEDYVVEDADQSSWTATSTSSGDFTALVSEGKATRVAMPLVFNVAMPSLHVSSVSMKVIPAAAGAVQPRPTLSVSYFFHGEEMAPECELVDEENVLTVECEPFAADNLRVELAADSTADYVVSQFHVRGSKLENNAFIYYLPDEEDVDCSQSPEESFPVNLRTGEAMLYFTEFGAMKACFRFGSSPFVARSRVNVVVNFAYVTDVLVSTVVVGDSESKDVVLTGEGMSEEDTFKVVYESCAEEPVFGMEAQVSSEEGRFMARVKLSGSEKEQVHLCYRFAGSRYYMIPQIVEAETPYTLTVKDVKTFAGATGFGTSALVSVQKEYVLGGFGISDNDNLFFRENSCANSEGAFNVRDSKVTVSLDKVGSFFLCYRFAGENIVAYRMHTVRVAQVSSMDPRYVVVDEENVVELSGAELVEEDAFGFTRSGVAGCVMVSSELSSSTLALLTHTFTQLGEYTMCVRLSGDANPYVVSNVMMTVLSEHTIDNVENTVFPVTTVESRDTHVVTIYGKTVRKEDRVKFVETSCSEEATEYAVEKGDLKVAVRAVFSKMVPELHVCYKFTSQSNYVMTNYSIHLLYMKSVAPDYVIREVDSLVRFVGEGLDSGKVRLADDDMCTIAVGEKSISKNVEGYFAELYVSNDMSEVFVCVKYAAYDENYHFTGLMLDVYGLESVSVSKWLVNLYLPSPESVNTEGLVLTGRGLDQARVSIVRANRNCMALGEVLEVSAMNATDGKVTRFLAEPFVMTQPGEYRFCVRFGETRPQSYDHITFTVEPFAIAIQDSTGLVSVVKSDESSSKSVTFTGAVTYYREMDVKVVDAENCAAEPVESVVVSVNGYVAELTALTGVETPLHFCVTHNATWHYMSGYELLVKELTMVKLGDMENTLKVTEDTYALQLSGFHVGAGDKLKYVPTGMDCSEVSVLTYEIGNSRIAELVIVPTLPASTYEVCYEFAGETEYAKYASKTLEVYLIASVEPTYLVANKPTELTITGLGRAVGDKLWFAEEACGAVPADAVVVESLESVTVTVTNPQVKMMCYNFPAFGTVEVATTIVVYSVTGMSHTKWLTNVPLPTNGFAAEGVTTALRLTGTHFGLDNRVKFVQSATSCEEGVSTDPVQMNSVSVDGQTATLMAVTFTEPGDYYLCIVHHAASNQYVHYDHKISVVETMITTVRDDPVLFVLTEEAKTDSVSFTEDFLQFVQSPESMVAVWTESMCDNYVLTADVAREGSQVTVTSRFTRSFNTLHLCLRLPGLIYVPSRVRKVFKVFTVLESPVPFVSETVSDVTFNIQGQNLKVDDQVAFVASSASCNGAQGVTLNSGSVTVSLGTAHSVYKVCYRLSEFGETSAYYELSGLEMKIYQVTSVSPKTLVQAQTQTFHLTLKSHVLPEGVMVRVISASGSCTSLAAGVDALVSTDNTVELTPADETVFDEENQVCVRLSETTPFFSYTGMDVHFARVIPVEEPVFQLTGLQSEVLFSNQALATDQFKFVPETSDCSSLSAVTFTLNEKTAVFTLTSGFMNYKLCYQFTNSQGFFEYAEYMVNMLPVSTEKMTEEEVKHVFSKLSSPQSIISYLMRATTVEPVKVEKEVITNAASSLVLTDVAFSPKVFQVLYGMNYDIDTFAKTVVPQLDVANVTTFVGSYAQQVKVAYESGTGSKPQQMLLDLVTNVGADSAKVDAIIEGWRQLADSSATKEVSGETSFDFSDGSQVTLTPVGSSRRLAGESEAAMIKINRFECSMVDMEILEGPCFEVLINGNVANELPTPYWLEYTRRDMDDTACASKESIQAMVWTKKPEGETCVIKGATARLQGKKFGVVTTSTISPDAPAVFDTTVLTVLLVICMVIFFILFVAFGYALWVYVHPKTPKEANDLWNDFDSERQKRLDQRREDRKRRKQELMEMEKQFDMGAESEETDEEHADFALFQNAMPNAEGSDVDEMSDFMEALHGVNESSKYAQMSAENAEIVQEDVMDRDEDVGEVRDSLN